MNLSVVSSKAELFASFDSLTKVNAIYFDTNQSNTQINLNEEAEDSNPSQKSSTDHGLTVHFDDFVARFDFTAQIRRCLKFYFFH